MDRSKKEEREGEGDLRAGAAGSASSDMEGGREGGIGPFAGDYAEIDDDDDDHRRPQSSASGRGRPLSSFLTSVKTGWWARRRRRRRRRSVQSLIRPRLAVAAAAKLCFWGGVAKYPIARKNGKSRARAEGGAHFPPRRKIAHNWTVRKKARDAHHIRSTSVGHRFSELSK